MLYILVAGGYDDADPKAKEIEKFATILGEEIITQGHILLTGCQTNLDKVVAKAAYEKLNETHDPDPDRRVISYILLGRDPAHTYGKIIRSQLENWEIETERLYVPEQIHLANVVILVGGFDGTYRAANWARIEKKPILAVAFCGGSATKVYEMEFGEFDKKYAGRIDKIEYQELNSINENWHAKAKKIVSLAEKIVTSKSVLVVMSYSGRSDIDDAYDSFEAVCKEFGYNCKRVQSENAIDRIVPRILEEIGQAAFVIADLTELKQNVFYELGYAEGLGRPVVVTAKNGTDLPFDVKEIPTIFWDGQKKLKEDLRTKIRMIADKQGR